jgi:hypothetical protein
VIGDITPRSPVDRLKRDYSKKELQREFDAELVAAVVGMSRAFITRALDRPGTRPKTFTLAEVLILLDVDGFQETFIPRSKIPKYLLEDSAAPPSEIPALQRSSRTIGDVKLVVGNARDLLPRLEPASVQCVTTSSPYWGMRVYDNERNIRWADGESCPYGFEQTPEGFIRHTIELLVLIKPAITKTGSVWWNIMDTYNTRTPIRGNARERLDAMSDAPGSRKGWTEHGACRHSAGHMYLDDTELSSIPARIAHPASATNSRASSPGASTRQRPNQPRAGSRAKPSTCCTCRSREHPSSIRRVGRGWRRDSAARTCCLSQPKKSPTSGAYRPRLAKTVTARNFRSPSRAGASRSPARKATSYSIRSSAPARRQLPQLSSAGAAWATTSARRTSESPSSASRSLNANGS